jgi:outer membrane immunogenic protein
MKKLLASAVALAFAPSAFAADLPVQTYAKAPSIMVAAYDWTGFYLGVNAGVGLARDRAQHFVPAVPFLSSDSLYLSPQGGLGGGQICYNWQIGSVFGPLVLGVEADIEGAGFRDDGTSVANLIPLDSRTHYKQQVDWFGTVRGRLGIANGPVLSYVTGGYAVGSINTTVTEGATAFSTGNRMQGGWTIGSGVEASLGGNWTGKIEYLHLNLGNKTDTLFTTQTLNTEIRANIFRVGLNYRTGSKAAYLPVAANWTGFYLGGNIGSGTGRDRSSLAGPFGPNEIFNLAPDGINGGVQVGYNWQAANWVYGVEADIQGSSQRDNKTCVFRCSDPANFATRDGQLSAAYDARLPWFGTIRGRLGYSVGSTLLYATGGFAYGGVKTRITLNDGTGVNTVNTTQLSDTRGGWTVGAGIETPFTLLGMFGPNWTAKSEYIYVDLGTTTDLFKGFSRGAFAASTGVTEHIFRSGLNYHFSSPMVARY